MSRCGRPVNLVVTVLTAGGDGWGVGLIPFLVGVALLVTGASRSPSGSSSERR